ncbi:MAG: hypothetical protein KAQ69_10055 [Spirochaetales bacterium]|nr:hypothetical protein [Spirochaetales bacterium]
MEKYVHACDKGIDWCLQYLKDDGSPAMPEPCFDSFYKFPAALNVMGKHREAASLLNWIEMKTLKPNGDMTFKRQKVIFDWHKNFYLYTNSWIVIGAQRAGFFNLAHQAMQYILTYQNPETGAFRSRPIEQDKDNLCDMTITGNCGIACLFTGHLNEAFHAADALCSITQQQDGGPVYYYTLNSQGRLWKDLPQENQESYCLDQRKPQQYYWYIGISAALLLHCYQISHKKEYLENALYNLNFLSQCQKDVLKSFASGKYAYALALAYRTTGDEEYRQKALSYCDWLIQVQKDDGSWDNDQNNLEWYLKWDMTSEMTYWIKEVTAILSSAQKKI